MARKIVISVEKDIYRPQGRSRGMTGGEGIIGVLFALFCLGAILYGATAN